MKKYRILYEDRDIFVLYKPSGLAVQSARPSVPDMMSMLRSELMERGERGARLGLVNRLDQPVEGILLVGKNEKAAADLNRQIQDHIHTEKWYQALVCGKLSPKEGTLVDYLLKDGRTNTSRIVPEGTKGGKRSELRYETLREQEGKSLLRIRLLTGRHHQIRVQLAHAGAPIAGDLKYGAADAGQLCLCAFKMTFLHPRTRERMSFEVEPSFPALSTAPE